MFKALIYIEGEKTMRIRKQPLGDRNIVGAKIEAKRKELGRMLFVFLENNMDQYALDASRGQGETLETIAGIMNVSVEKVATLSQEHFGELFPTQDTEVLHVASRLMEIIKAEG